MNEQQTQQAKIQRRRSRAEIEQLVAEFEASGLGRTAFCRQRGLSLSTLARYRSVQQQTSGEATNGKRWLAVEISGVAAATGGGGTSGLAVALPGGWRIEVGRGFDDETLKRLLGVVGRR